MPNTTTLGHVTVMILWVVLFYAIYNEEFGNKIKKVFAKFSSWQRFINWIRGNNELWIAGEMLQPGDYKIGRKQGAIFLEGKGQEIVLSYENDTYVTRLKLCGCHLLVNFDGKTVKLVDCSKENGCSLVQPKKWKKFLTLKITEPGTYEIALGVTQMFLKFNH